MKGVSVDLIIHNAQIHTLDASDRVLQAIAIRNGKIIEVGAERQILNKYSAEQTVDAQGKDVYPGLTDAHGHMLMYAKQLLGVDLRGVKSLQEMIHRCEQYKAKNPNLKFIVGQGWDQNLWANQEMPTNEQLNILFASIPVCLYRVDGHAALVNDFLLKKSDLIQKSAPISDGEVVIKNNKPTGLLIDNAMSLVQPFLPDFSKKAYLEALLMVQDELLQYGITSVHEAGIDFEHISWLKELIDKHSLHVNLYAMLMDTPKNRAFVQKHGKYRYKNLVIRSFKCFADGALGSRGALLKGPYHDHPESRGLLLTEVAQMQNLAKFCLAHGYQMNTHSIGDSANALVLSIYQKVFNTKPDHRFRIEHAQILDPKDFIKFSQFAVFPSVQPTHAISDAHWAEKRLGKDRLKGAYAYQTLFNQFGMIALGTDFPVEQINPFATIQAASNNPFGENLQFDQIIKGMTIYAAFASFQEKQLGTLEKGKDATLAIFEYPINTQLGQVQNYAWRTFIKGKCVFKLDAL